MRTLRKTCTKDYLQKASECMHKKFFNLKGCLFKISILLSLKLTLKSVKDQHI